MSLLSETRREELLTLFERVQVAHHIPGRIRLKIKGRAPQWLTSDPASTQTQIEALRGVLQVKLNPLAGSATITYERTPEAFEHFDALRSGNVAPLLEYFTREVSPS
ncbi:hypothetical protein LGV61_10085 [Desulfurispirillum indicum]|nr:hypothetical protein [Desulfurispirillum indicum]UCZ56070.1 hypothetical protein LGV61_10085 [Desulfurispirillum indicum]